jgi:hypothetical protein
MLYNIADDGRKLEKFDSSDIRLARSQPLASQLVETNVG